jgi:hypothetical protein
MEWTDMSLRFLVLLAVLTVFVSGIATANDDLKMEFVLLDRAFIPPLFLTNQGDIEFSKKAIKTLESHWIGFKTKNYNLLPNDPEWKRDLDKVEAIIQDAKQIILTGGSISKAHELLESIRYVFTNARRRNGVEYYIDHLTDFHVHMEAIFHRAVERNAVSFTEQDREFIAAECLKAVVIWNEVYKLIFNKELFGFSEKQESRRIELIESEAQALSLLQKALQTNDKAMIIKSAKGIRQSYSQLYLLFGDFRKIDAPI